MGKSKIKRNIKIANLAKSLFQNREFERFISLFSPDGSLVFHADAAKCGEVPLIPYAGTFNGRDGIREYIRRFVESPFGGANLGPTTNILFNCDGDVVLTFTITVQSRRGAGLITTNYIIKFEFNKCGQIELLEIFSDVSALTLFYSTECPPRQP